MTTQTTQVNIRIPTTLIRWIDNLAKIETRTRSNTIIFIITEYKKIYQDKTNELIR